MGERDTDKPHPKIIGIKNKKIKDKEPPNNKIIEFNIVENKSKKNE